MRLGSLFTINALKPPLPRSNRCFKAREQRFSKQSRRWTERCVDTPNQVTVHCGFGLRVECGHRNTNQSSLIQVGLGHPQRQVPPARADQNQGVFGGQVADAPGPG